jgi:hypothetical protein
MGLFNSEEYAWKDMKVVIAGRPVLTTQSVQYTTERNLEPNYGAGDEPHSIQAGNKSFTGEIGLNQSDIEALNRSAKGQGANDLTDIAFDVVVNFSKTVTDPQVTDVLRHCRISSLPKGWNQGDSKMVITCQMMILKIEYDI